MMLRRRPRNGLTEERDNAQTFFHHLNSSPWWRLRRGDDRRMTKYQAIRVLANPNTSPNKGSSSKEVIMVDPLEAKRLAAKQMERVQAKEKLKKQRRIEAINGAWAMIGLTAGLVIEGHTGKNIVAQLSGYWDAFIGFFFR
ncbi:uncharacterized protein LOC127248579 isoform X4 [Andrographis paniculata]|uniref:uncharacterized protein LOC127248579 isoform X4 n=1 Tax=Andrographis paniculata TaxID=175694 RepID=UPI0021E8C409|nr:uncharacterized protein LOC127248579 isoform X4 [Andrographis paniculata]